MEMRFWRLFLLLIVFTISLSATAWAAGKIGYFEMQAVLQESKWGKRVNDDLKRQGEAIKADVDVKAKAFKTAKDEFDKKKDVMDDKAKSKKVKELQDMLTEGEKLSQEANAKLNKLVGDTRGPLIDKVIEIVKQIGREGGYDYIFERETAGLVYGTEKENITRRIIEDLDKAAPKK